MRKNILLLLAAICLVSCSSKIAKHAPGRVDVHGDALPEGAVARMGTLRLKQSGPYGSVTLSEDDRVVALFGSGVVSVSEMTTGRLLARTESFGRDVEDARFSDNDKSLLLVVGQRVYSWAWQEDQPPQQVFDLYGRSDEEVRFPLALIDDQHVLAVRYRGINTPDHKCWIGIVDISTGTSQHTYHFEMGMIKSVAVSQDGKWLAVADGWAARLIDLASGTASVLAENEQKGLFSLAFSPDGRTVAAGEFYPHQGVVRIWDVQTKQELDPIPNTVLGTRVVAFTPDGHLVYAGEAGKVSLWDITSKQKLREFDVGRNVNDIAFTDDGQLAALATSQDRQREVVVWDMKADGPLLPFEGHHLPILAVLFSPDGELLFTATETHTIRAWRAKTGEFLYEIGSPQLGHGPKLPPAMAISPDGAILAVGEKDHIVFRDPSTGTKTGGYVSQGSRIYSLAFSPDGERLACLSIDREVAPEATDARFHWRTLVVRKVSDGEELTRVSKLPHYLNHCEFSADGQLVAIQKTEGAYSEVTVWSSWSGELVREIPASAFAFSPDGQVLAVHEPGGIRLWDIAAGEVIREFPQSEKWFDSMTFSPDGRTLAVNYPDWDRSMFFRIYDVATGEIIYEGGGHEGDVTVLAYSRDGRFLVTGSKDTTALVWELPKTVRSPEHLADDMIPVRVFGPDRTGEWARAFFGDGRYLLTGNHSHGRLQLWDTKTWRLVRRFDEQERGTYPVAVTPDGNHIILMNNRYRTTRVWSVPTDPPAQLADPSGDNANFIEAEWHIEGRWELEAVAKDASWMIAHQAKAEEFVMFDIRTGEEIRRFAGHAGGVGGVKASSDGLRLASGDDEGIIRLWEANTGEELARFSGHEGPARPLAFSPDGQRVFSSGEDGTLRTWSIATGQQVDSLRIDLATDRPIFVSPASRYALLAGYARTLGMYDLRTGRERPLPRFDEITGWIRGIQFSPDGRYVVYGDELGIWRRRLPD